MCVAGRCAQWDCPDANSSWQYPSGSQVLMPLEAVTSLPEAMAGLCLLLHRIVMAEGLPCSSGGTMETGIGNSPHVRPVGAG